MHLVQHVVANMRLQSERNLLIYGVKLSQTEYHYFGQVLDDEGVNDGSIIPIITEIGYHVVTENTLIQLKSGRLLLPCAYTENEHSSFAVGQIYYSDDDGENWDLAPQTLIAPLSSETGIQFPQLAELHNDRVSLWSGDTCWISANQGITWERTKI